VRGYTPILDAWLDRLGGSLNFWMTQLLSDHGCFGAFLCRIGKESTNICWHCSVDIDTADHTLRVCPSWGTQREVLMESLGLNQGFQLRDVVARMVASRQRWLAFSKFAVSVMGHKEEAERVREQNAALVFHVRDAHDCDEWDSG